MSNLMPSTDVAVRILAFSAATLAVIATAPSDIVPPLVGLIAGALAAGCTAVLSLMRAPGQPFPPRPPSLPERSQRG